MQSWKWVGESVVNEANGVNGLYNGIQNLMTKHEVYTDLVAQIPQGFKDAVGGFSITLIALFLLLDFLKKTTDLKWVTWENVLMFFIKFIIAKVCVDNAEWLMTCIYNGFSSLTDALVSAAPTPAENAGLSGSSFLEDIYNNVAQIFGVSGYSIFPVSTGPDAWRDPDLLRYFLSSTDVTHVVKDDFVWLHDFTPIGVWLLVVIQGIIMKAIMIVAFVIVMARFMELAIYTVAAPLPLATLGSEGLQDIGKSYLKSYAACCIHAFVLLLIFICFSALNTIPSLDGGKFFDSMNIGGFYGLVKTFILGATVMKSEQWAKRICGAM